MSNQPFEVILSHEHTDFDALASMLAASLLYPNATPVLPQHLNRNVREFLALYRNQFDFVRAADLPRGHVDRAILVDTRAANWTKGMDKRTEFYVIDHHSLHEELPSGWQAWTDAVGANTTLLVERLIEHAVALTPVQATLLTLGIHEDTGSLTYASTTYRDAQCLTWLLQPDRRVNMAVVSRFLSHPLSETQRQLLETLLANSEFVEIAGHTIVIAQAVAHSFRDEISALASRLRDYHETDAVFLVIDLGDVVQVVARSSTDEIDVGQVARALGGGGHTRAAAAPVHGRSLQPTIVRDQIVDLVGQYSRSAVRVQHIMSKGRPQTLVPDMTIDRAYELMRRYGHEGFPVLERQPDGQEVLLGVLTRREADRAVNHRLGDEMVSRFMRAGHVVIQQNASIPTLRRLMIDSNWGQIPVVDDDDQIIGIVTRTDLIKLWDEASLPQHRVGELVQRLRDSLAPDQHYLLELVGREVEQLDYTVYVVGGFVRDLLLNSGNGRVAALDMDVVIEGDAIAFAQGMQADYGGRVVPHRRFRTAKWLLNDSGNPVDMDRLFAGFESDLQPVDLPGHLDFVTARTEFYTAPTVLPTVESSSIKLDLHRRDFTINTLALCLNPDRWGELLDFYGGVADLREGVIRVLHSLSFVDDPTRILRAIRYEQRFGFTIAARTLELLFDALDMLERVSPARLRHELDRILQEAQPERALARLDELGVLSRFHPDLHVTEQVQRKFVALRAALAKADPDPRLQAQSIERLYWGLLTYELPADVDEMLIERLGLRGETQRLVENLEQMRARLPQLVDPMRPSQIVALLDRGDPGSLALLEIICDDEYQQWALRTYDAKWRHVRAALDGNDLRALGIQSGPAYGEVLRALRLARLDAEITDRDQEVELVQAMLAADESLRVRTRRDH